MKERETAPPTVVCFGELLWDILPTGRFPGGAPGNVSYHLRQMGIQPFLVSAVGDDLLGNALLCQLQRWGLAVEGISLNADQSTGVVRGDFSAFGEVSYDIAQNAAWDYIVLTESALVKARSARALVFGSLAQRLPRNRRPLELLLAALPKRAARVFDVNLRAPHDDLARVRDLGRMATLVKANTAEAARLLGIPTNQVGNEEAMARQLAVELGGPDICLTAGERGAGLLCGQRWYWEAGRPVASVDPVGAGDAFLAAWLAAWLRGATPAVCLANACRLGEWVASCAGATPSYEDPSCPNHAYTVY